MKRKQDEILSSFYGSFCSNVVTIQCAGKHKAGRYRTLDPVSKVVTPGKASAAPSDAIALFDGSSANNWESSKGGPARWTLADGVLTIKAGAGDIRTKRNFKDFQLHIEWRTPAEVKGKGQGRGNSGIFLQDRYELQVLDCYNNLTYSNDQAGSIYKQSIPLVNASLPPISTYAPIKLEHRLISPLCKGPCS
jgi:hypothetical protein